MSAGPGARAFVTGLALSLAVNLGFVLVLVSGFGSPSAAEVRGSDVGPSPYAVRHGLCGVRRCTLPESRLQRREPEPDPVSAVSVLQAELMPALGMREQDPKVLPKLQTYEQKEIVEDGVNLDRDNTPPPEELKKRFDARKAKMDRRVRSAKDLLDFEDDDPRRRATKVADIVGVADGDVAGRGSQARPGSVYLRQLQRELEKNFRVPTYLSAAQLSSLQVRVRIRRMGPDGSIEEYDIQRLSGNRGFDDAAVALLNQYVPDEKGKKRLPVPSPEVLRYINATGRLKIDLAGERLR